MNGDVSARLLEDFASPPAEFRPVPLWIWNGEVTRERIREMLEQFQRQGMGGVFIHPRPGLVTEYLSETWFDLWAFALAECKRLGLGCHIYDENSYPSGFAGGHVMAENPLCALRFIKASLCPPGSVLPSGDGVLAAFVVGEDGVSVERVDLSALASRSCEKTLVVLEWGQDRNRLWTAGFSQVDLALPGTTDQFLRSTHSRYAERFAADFGGAIRFAFSDEPSLATGGLHASYYFLTEFRRDHGYSLEDRLEAFITGGDAAYSVRYDYFATLQRLWVTHFLRPMHDWCGAHGLQFTGHFNEHHWPNMAGQPNNMLSQRWMHAPGTDLLGFQFSPESARANGLFFLNLKECRSVANQMGYRRVLCETTGGGGYDMEVDGFKRLTDYAMALGVNLINPHLSHQTLAGARKYDWPHTLSDHSPWWANYRMQADHEARVAVLLSAGVEENRVLVLHPTGSAWMYSLPSGFNLGTAGASAAAWRKAALRTQGSLLESLYSGQVDFDLGDEWMLEELGSVEGDQLRVGQARYGCVVIPPMMETIRPETLDLLGKFVTGGGQVHLFGSGPDRINGRRPGPGDHTLEQAKQGWNRHNSVDGLVDALRLAIPPRLSAPGGGSLPAGLVWAWRRLPDGSQMVFLANPWQEMIEGEVVIEGNRVTNLETFSGRFLECTVEEEGGKIRLPFQIRQAMHCLWWVRREERTGPGEFRDFPRWAVDLQWLSARRDEPNVHVLDYCDLELPTRRFCSINTVRADRLNWQEHGFPHNPWSGSIQFKRVFLEFPFGPDSGFAVTYRFQLGDLGEAMRTLEIAWERPWLYRAMLNGQEVDTGGGRRWWDENVRAFPVGEWVRVGENVLRMEVRPMHPLAEIMPVYILGDFALAPATVGFRLEPSRPIGRDSWAEAGLYFYCRSVTYRYHFTTEQPAREILINPGAWRGSAVTVSVDGQKLVDLVHPRAVVRVPFELGPGAHELQLALFGSLKNQVGPFFSDGLPGIWSWMDHPETAPAGVSYCFEPTGLTDPLFVSLA